MTEGDYFDGLRTADAERIAWVRAARRFESLVWRVHGKRERQGFEDAWARTMEAPMAHAADAESLIEEVKDAIRLQYPLTFEEAADGGFTGEDVRREVGRWTKGERKVRDAYDDGVLGAL